MNSVTGAAPRRCCPCPCQSFASLGGARPLAGRCGGRREGRGRPPPPGAEELSTRADRLLSALAGPLPPPAVAPAGGADAGGSGAFFHRGVVKRHSSCLNTVGLFRSYCVCVVSP